MNVDHLTKEVDVTMRSRDIQLSDTWLHSIIRLLSDVQHERSVGRRRRRRLPVQTRFHINVLRLVQHGLATSPAIESDANGEDNECHGGGAQRHGDVDLLVERHVKAVHLSKRFYRRAAVWLCAEPEKTLCWAGVVMRRHTYDVPRLRVKIHPVLGLQIHIDM